MNFIRGTDWKIEGSSAVTLGKFDGMHRGHQVLLNELMKYSRKELTTIVFTFGTSPYELLKGSKQVLMTNEEKELFCEYSGADLLIEYPFTDEVCRMSAEEFVKKVIVEQMHAKVIIVGTDFGFGYKRQGNVELLRALAPVYGFEVRAMEKLSDDTGREISSTYIREELELGHMEKAADLMGTPYSVHGQIIHGNRLGRTYGIPTINMVPDPHKILPPNGVYVSRAWIGGRIYGAVSNIGVRPTVSDEKKINLETFLFDFEGELYGETATIELLHFVRPERKFASVDELQKQIHADSDAAKKWLQG